MQHLWPVAVGRLPGRSSLLQKKKALQNPLKKPLQRTIQKLAQKPLLDANKKDEKPRFKRQKADVKLHTPVLLNEVLQSLNLKPNGVYIDATFGGGGHTRAILDAMPSCKVIGIDRDFTLAPKAGYLKELYPGRLHFVNGRFGNVLNPQELAPLLPFPLGTGVDGILFDLGVSSFQIGTAERGFSFRNTLKGPLDMRMEGFVQSGRFKKNEMREMKETALSEIKLHKPPKIKKKKKDWDPNDYVRDPAKISYFHGISAYDVVNKFTEHRIAQIIYNLGDEPKARQIARKIIEQREIKPIEDTFELANLIRSCFKQVYKEKLDPATKTFQALRMFVNDELRQLEQALIFSEQLLAPQGRLAVIAFHGGEGKIVKDVFNFCSKPKASAEVKEKLEPSMQIVKKLIVPTDEEIERNPRSRSAKLRVAERLDSPSISRFYPRDHFNPF